MNRQLIATLVAATLVSGVTLAQPVAADPALVAQAGDARALYDQALQSYNAGQYQAAVAVLDQAISLNSQFAEARVLRGLAREKTNQPGGTYCPPKPAYNPPPAKPPVASNPAPIRVPQSDSTACGGGAC
jgi:tetratricopeptide (TPR) repeat protein